MSSSSEQPEQERVLPEAVRQRNRAVAEREASRLARPENRRVGRLGHASRQKSAVMSVPVGVHHRKNHDDDEEWCGPFSVARQMIAKREEARRQREAEQQETTAQNHPLDALMEGVEWERKRKAHPSLQWKGTPSSSEATNMYSQRKARIQHQIRVPSLFDLCVSFLVQHFEHVQALGNVDASIRRSLADGLAAHHKLGDDYLDILFESGVETLELTDCAQVTSEKMVKLLSRLLPTGLKILSLHHSGRCFGPAVVQVLSNAPLLAISIGGAYLLQDQDAVKLIGPETQSVEFIACPNLGPKFCEALAKSNRLLELSLQDVKLTKGNILKMGDALKSIKSLKLKHIENVDDEVVDKLLSDSLEALDLSFCYQLTDVTLSSIRSKSPNLRSLTLHGCKNLTEIGLETLFTPVIEGLPSPPQLKHLNLADCGRGMVTDNVLGLVCRAASMKRDQDAISEKYQSFSGGLVHLNLMGSACTDTTLEQLAVTSALSLKDLNVSFCPHVSDKGLGYLVSKVGLQLRKIHIWGCAQLTEEFLDGHARVKDPTLNIVGAWIKKGNAVSLR